MRPTQQRPPVQLRHDPIARITLYRTRTEQWPGDRCRNCGNVKRLYHYYWATDDSTSRRDYARVYCSIGCYDSHTS